MGVFELNFNFIRVLNSDVRRTRFRFFTARGPDAVKPLGAGNRAT